MDKLVPSVQQYMDGLKSIKSKINAKQLQMLKNHYAAPAHALTAGALGDSVGYRGYKGANRWYGDLAEKLAEAMGFDWRPESRVAVSVLASFVKPGSISNTEWLWVMRANLATALEELGWVGKTSHLYYPPGFEPNPTD